MSIEERIQAGEFNSKVPFLTREQLLEQNLECRKIKKELDEVVKKERELKDQLSEEFRKQNYLFYQSQQEARKRFREALEIECEMTLHPKRDKIWEKAWREGCVEGLFDVLHTYTDLVELLG